MLFHHIEDDDAIWDLVAGRSDEEVLTELDGKPALMHLEGDLPGPHRMISVMLHGNEDSGLRGLLAWLRDKPRPTHPLWLFIGNVRAATQDGWFAHRYLPDQEDFNRVWGIHPVSTRMRRCAAEVLEIVTAHPLEAAIDVHNNTGDNPLYAIVPRPLEETYALAGAVSDVGLLWGTQEFTLMQALEPYCPAIAVECGMAGVPEHGDLAKGVIERFVAMPHVDPTMPRPPHLFEVRYRVEVRPEVAFDFVDDLDPDELDFAILPGLDRNNFGMLLAGVPIGKILPGSDLPLVVTDVDGNDETERLFDVRVDGTVVTSEDMVPAMMTRTHLQTRRDCLFYVVRRRPEAGGKPWA